MKALVYRMGGLGDSILIYPVLEILTKKGFEVTVWGNTEYFYIAKIAGLCKNITFYKPKEDFDLKIFFSKNKELVSEKDKNAIFIDPIPPKKVWAVNYYLEKLKLRNMDYSKTLKLNLEIKKDPKLCIIHPGSGSKKKNPEITFFCEVEKILNNYEMKTLYLLGPAQRELIGFFKNSLYTENIFETTKILLKASLYIGTDSGLTHLSAYLGVPSLVIFGPTDPLVWHPIGEKIFTIRTDECDPCYPNICDERRCLKKDVLLEKTLTCLNHILPNYN
ncbi:MAG: glycosyltransferase family 9 protein [Thermodesulfovibrio sp.]|nr:glycosyltransferase family 9 protein [Thermodesulfovibrio sp.]